MPETLTIRVVAAHPEPVFWSVGEDRTDVCSVRLTHVELAPRLSDFPQIFVVTFPYHLNSLLLDLRDMVAGMAAGRRRPPIAAVSWIGRR
jgi:hypothetical protein